MPVLNKEGVPSIGFMRCWYDLTRTVFQQCDPDCRITLSDGTELSPLGGNTVIGGECEQWAAWLQGTGVFDSFGRLFPLADIGQMGPDGTYAFKSLRNSGGPDEPPAEWSLLHPDGSMFLFRQGNAEDPQPLGGNDVLWAENGYLKSTVGLHAERGWWFRAHRGFDWDDWNLLYQHNPSEQLILNGHIIGPKGVYFRPDFEFRDGKYRVVYSFLNNYEGSDAYAWIVLTPEELAAKPLINAPQPIEEGTMIPAFERPMWMAPFFSYHTRYGDTPPDKYTGNAIIQLADDTDQGRFPGFGMPLIVDMNCPDPDLNLTVAWWISGAAVDELPTKAAQAEARAERPTIAYLDNRNWPTTNPFLSTLIWPGVQAYRGASESLADFENSVTAVLDKVRGYGLPICLVTRFDDFNGTSSIERTLECMPLYEEWIREYPIVAHLPFSDRRGNGIAANQSLWNWARTFQYAIPFGRPNRFDYWRPSGVSIKEILENKFGQTRASVVIEPYLREDILRRYL